MSSELDGTDTPNRIVLEYRGGGLGTWCVRGVDVFEYPSECYVGVQVSKSVMQ